jgi:hypothetical protein
MRYIGMHPSVLCVFSDAQCRTERVVASQLLPGLLRRPLYVWYVCVAQCGQVLCLTNPACGAEAPAGPNSQADSTAALWLSD